MNTQPYTQPRSFSFIRVFVSILLFILVVCVGFVFYTLNQEGPAKANLDRIYHDLLVSHVREDVVALKNNNLDVGMRIILLRRVVGMLKSGTVEPQDIVLTDTEAEAFAIELEIFETTINDSPPHADE